MRGVELNQSSETAVCGNPKPVNGRYKRQTKKKINRMELLLQDQKNKTNKKENNDLFVVVVRLDRREQGQVQWTQERDRLAGLTTSKRERASICTLLLSHTLYVEKNKRISHRAGADPDYCCS